MAAEVALQHDAPADDLRTARLRLVKRRMAEALLALKEAGLRQASAYEVARLEQVYAHELATYRQLHGRRGHSSGPPDTEP
jgi:hypothetical protein